MDRSFYVKRGARVVGPTGLATLRQYASTGRLRETDLVCESTEGPWLPAIQVEDLARVLASPGDHVDNMAVTSDPGRERELAGPGPGDRPLNRSVFRSRKPVLFWSLLGGVLLLLMAGGGVAVFLLGGGDSDERPLQLSRLSASPEHCERAMRLDAAARVLDRANSWIADSTPDDDGDLAGRRDELKATATEFGDSGVVGVECLRIDGLLDRYTRVRVELEGARQAFVDLDPANARYRGPAEAAAAAGRVGVARLTRSADDFLEVLQLAQDDQAAIKRLVPMSRAEFDRATLVMPLKSTAPPSRMLALARFHSHLRTAGRAAAARERLFDERMARTVAENRKATAATPLVLETVAKMKATVAAIATRNGSRVILAWSPGSDCFWPVPADAADGLSESLQAAGLATWPSSDRSLKVRVPDAMLDQLAGWVAQQRQATLKVSGGKPRGERPLFLVSKPAKEHFLSMGHWGEEPEVVVAGELGIETDRGVARVVLGADSIVVGVAPTVATLAHIQKHWGLAGRVIRRDTSFPVTLHRPRTTRMMGGNSGPTFNPFGDVGTEKAGGGEAGYLRILAGGDEAEIKAVNETVTAHMQAEVRKTQTILSAATQSRLEQGLVPLVGSKQARVDARAIGGAGLRAVLGAHRLAAATDRLYPNGALYTYNITAVRTSLSAKGQMLFDSEIRDRVLEFVIARDGIWLLSSHQLCDVAETALSHAGFYTKGGRKPLLPTDRDPDVTLFEPSLPPTPSDPRAPPLPVVIIEPAGPDQRLAVRQYVAGRATAHQRALKMHEQNIANGVYNGENDWRRYQQSVVEWKRARTMLEEQLVLRKTRLGESVRLREGLQATWSQIAQVAVDGVRKRAGRPEKPGDGEKVDSRNIALLPSIQEALGQRLTGGGR